MPEIDILMDDIEKLRERLYRIIAEKNDNMLDPELLSAGEDFNEALNRYNRAIRDGMKNED